MQARMRRFNPIGVHYLVAIIQDIQIGSTRSVTLHFRMSDTSQLILYVKQFLHQIIRRQLGLQLNQPIQKPRIAIEAPWLRFVSGRERRDTATPINIYTSLFKDSRLIALIRTKKDIALHLE